MELPTGDVVAAMEKERAVGDGKQVPKQPWEDVRGTTGLRPHAVLAPKSSLPAELPGEGNWPHLMAQQQVAGGLPFCSHLPISRTVSDSYGQQRRKNASFAASRSKLESEDSSYDSDHDGQEQQQHQQHQQQQKHLQQPRPLPPLPLAFPPPTSHPAAPTLLPQQSAGPRLLPFMQVSKSHDDVSRTPSETLASEFAEYITLKKPSGMPAHAQQQRAGGRGVPQHHHQQQHQQQQQQQQVELRDPPEQHDLESLLLDPSYNSKVEFALRLGYNEDLLQRALVKLGHGAGQDQLLEELIRLQKAKPLVGGGGVEAEAGRTSGGGGSSSSASGRDHHDAVDAEARGERPPLSLEKELLPIVVDGSNVAMSHGNRSVFSCKGIRICVGWFQARGHKDITVFVPMWRKEASKPDTPILDQHILSELEREGLLSFTPSRQVQGRRFVCHDDRYILNLAADTGAVVVTNDNYKDLINEKPKYKKVIEEKILMYSFVNDRFMPPDDPLGRNGPTLEQFLRRSRGLIDQQPCPYGKKCTYGNKCKFFHAERGNQPQKSITDQLKEHSLQKISEVRARGHSRDSSPGSDQLLRTMSAQPLQRKDSGSFVQDKQVLCRTRTTIPRLNVPEQQLPLPGQQHPSLYQHRQFWHQPPPPPPPRHVWHSQPSGPLNLPNTSLPPPRPPPPVANWGAAAPVCLQPPPEAGREGGGRFPLPTPERQGPEGALDNGHRKLTRQLTINPTFDPRIHQQLKGNPTPTEAAAAAVGVQHPRNLLALSDPPPSSVVADPFVVPDAMFSGPAHVAVTRNSSAPENATTVSASSSPFVQVPSTADRGVAAEGGAVAGGPGVPGAQRDALLRRMGSTSDSQLHTLSDSASTPASMVGAAAVASAAAAVAATTQWGSRRGEESVATSVLATAVSPLIDSSDGVWQASSASSSASSTAAGKAPGGDEVPAEDHSIARSRLYYHLAKVFPEEQVLIAMRALPRETDPQKICSYILKLSQQCREVGK